MGPKIIAIAAAAGFAWATLAASRAEEPKAAEPTPSAQHNGGAGSEPKSKTCTEVEIPPPADGKGHFEMLTVCHL